MYFTVLFTSLIAIVSLNSSDSGDVCLIDIILVGGTHSAVVHYTISNADDESSLTISVLTG